MSTYLQLVNGAILESGADLDQYASDGSDFDSQYVDSLMPKFKTWVARAWQTIQQEAYDWEWMSEQAVVNINPGIMFYSPSPITWSGDDANPFVIYDTDDSPVVQGFTVSKVVNLTGQFTDQENFGYVDLTASVSSPINFGMKSGGEYFLVNTTGGGGDAEDTGVFALVATPVSWGNDLEFQVFPPTDGDVFYPITLNTFGTITTATELRIVVADIDTASITHIDTFPITATASVNTENATAIVLNVTEGFDSFFFLLNQRLADPEIDYMGVYAVTDGGWHGGIVKCFSRSLGGVYMPVSLKFDSTTITATSLGGGVIHSVPGAPIPSAGDIYNTSDTFFNGSATPDGATASATITLLTDPGPGGVFANVDLQYDNDLTGAVSPGADWYQSICNLLAYNQDFVGTIYKDDISIGIGFDFINSGGTLIDISRVHNTAPPSVATKNYIHSWKSFDWAEETQADDFVENLAEIDEQSFRLVTHEDPAPGLEIKIPYMHWELFRMRYDNATVPPSQPRIVTKDNTGRWRFYPAPDVPYTILFDYVRNPQQLVAYSDVPKGIPEDFMDLIIWRALMYYGEYDEQPSVVQRATRNYKDLLFRAELRFRDKFHFQPYKLW